MLSNKSIITAFIHRDMSAPAAVVGDVGAHKGISMLYALQCSDISIYSPLLIM